MNSIIYSALGRRLRRAVWQCLLLLLVGLGLSTTARSESVEGLGTPRVETGTAGQGALPGHRADSGINA